MANKKIKLTIDSILGGMSPYMYVSGVGQFQESVGIDPDQLVDFGVSTKEKAGGMITPSRYTKFSDTDLSGAPKWILTEPKNALLYVYASDGEVLSYNAGLTAGSETVIGTPTSGAGNGAAYYNNYLYFATPTDISRYGPLDGTPALTNTVWTGATLGSQTALVNTDYPDAEGVEYPNHAMHVHTDNKLYFCDFKDGVGYVHYIKTTKVTDEGDTNDASTYAALDLPFGYKPTDIESYGTDIVISAVQTDDTTLRQGKAALFFWDTVSPSFHTMVPIQETIIGALLNVNGNLYVFSGNSNAGNAVGVYRGGQTVQNVAFLETGHAPFAGAVDYYGSRVVWGTKVTQPEEAACVFSLGYKHPSLPTNALHNIIRSGASTSNPALTALKFAQQPSGLTPRVILGWKDDSAAYGLEKLGGSDTMDAFFMSEVFKIGQNFKINKLRIHLDNSVAANVSIIAKLLTDDEGTTYTLKTINNTNYAGKRTIVYKATDLTTNSSGPVQGEHNYYLQLEFQGTLLRSVILPITMEVELLPDK